MQTKTKTGRKLGQRILYRAARYIAQRSGGRVNAHTVLMATYWVPLWLPYWVKQLYLTRLAHKYYPQGYLY